MGFWNVALWVVKELGLGSPGGPATHVIEVDENGEVVTGG